ncbi:ATP-binding response regulator [Actibacterium ureilyticum]|uniref:ATP-binding response regulator n=1 Tax=Actibacterium ureilyticum TaxID=1590614 RepID=UPI001140E37B|nr:ATP-binding protein [Actibacterium ureilyticum]
MSGRALLPASFEKSAQAMAGRAMWLLLLAGILVLASLLPVPRLSVIMLLTAATTLFALVIVLLLMAAVAGRDTRGAVQNAQAFHATDIAPGFATDLDGAVLFRNDAAVERFGGDRAPTLARALGELFADPSSVIYRLQNRAEARGNAMEDVVTRRGHVRISVHRVGRDAFYWRFDEMEDRSAARGAETLSLPLMTVGRNGTVLFMNEAARSLLGGRARNAETVLGSGKLTSGVVMTLDGAEGPFQARVIDISGRSGRREIYFLPVTEVEQTNLLDDQFFDAVPVALMKLAPDGRILLANRLARNLLSIPDGLRNFNQHVDGLGRSVLDWLEDVLKGRAPNSAEVLRVQRDDREIFVQVTLERVYDAGQQAIVAVLQDATELKSLEAQFTQSQKMQAIGQLAGGVAHDFNNLLTAISGHCDLLLLRHEPDAPDYGDLMQIHQNANRAASLVGQLLAFSRKQTLRPELVDLTDALGDLTHLLNRLVGETIRIDLIHDPDLAMIRADKRQLEQVIMNLVVNARDAMADGGEIRIETETVELRDDLQRDRAVVPAGRYVQVRVTDQGSGIPKDKIDKIFEPFFTTKKLGEGTGLGLSTAYGIVKQSGGFIFVDSQIGQGTQFTLFFPAREEEVTQPAQTPDAALPAEPSEPALVLSPAARVPEDAPLNTAEDPDTAEDDAPNAPLLEPDEILFHTRRLPATGRDTDPEEDGFNLFSPQTDLDEPLQNVRALLRDPAPDAPQAPADATSEAPEPATTPAPATEADTAAGNGVVLLVEDEAPVRAFASRALRMRGFTVIEAENAEDALSTLQDRALSVDVFVTDVVMPGMDGPSWVQQALQDRPDTRVVFVSGYAEDSFSDTQSRIPNSVFLPKPFSLTELTSTVDAQMQ